MDLLARWSEQEGGRIISAFWAHVDHEADELTRGLRRGDGEAAFRLRAVAPGRTAPPYTIEDARLVIAAEHGFPTWEEYKHHVEHALPAEVELFDRLARRLADAYMAGDRDAIRTINWHYKTAFIWDHEPASMRQRLPRWSAAGESPDDLALDDAREMVAHAYGLPDWLGFVGHLTHRTGLRVPPAGAAAPPLPPFYTIDADAGVISVRGPMSARHWDELLGVMRERGIHALRAGGVDDRVVERVSRMEHITRLDFDGSVELTDAGMACLARLPMLEDLNLSGPKGRITDRGLDVLRRLPRLTRLQMCWQPKISDAGVSALAHCEALQSVDLMGTNTGDGAIAALAGRQALRRLRTGRQVTDAGLALLARIPAFAVWSGGDADVGLMHFEGGPTSLLVDGPFTDAGLAELAALQGIDSLNLFWHCTAFTGQGLAALAALPHLTFLGCDGKRCGDAAMREIAGLPALRMLMAQGTVATDDGFAALSRSPTIEYIWGRECPHLGGRGFSALAAMPNLRGLAVSCKGVDDLALASLTGFPALRDLMPMDVPDEGFRHIGACRGLRRLWCMYCRDTGDAATAHIAGLPALTDYYAGATQITDRSLGVLARMDTLESVEFWACAGITNAGVAALARLPHLRKVVLDGLPGVTAEARGFFGEAVRVTYTG